MQFFRYTSLTLSTATFRLRNFDPADLDEELSLANEAVQAKKKKKWARQGHEKREIRAVFSDNL